MKILYCMCSLYNPGGMERVLLNKVRYLKERMGWDVAVVTTDQHGKPTFYPFPDGVRIIDLGVNYTDDNGKNPVIKTIGYLWRRRKHRKALTELLLKERPDIVDSLITHGVHFSSKGPLIIMRPQGGTICGGLC